MTDDQRCRRGPECEAAELWDDPDTGERCRGGAPTTDGSPLCPTCIRYARYAIAKLPLDVAELTTLLIPSRAIAYSDPDMPGAPRGKKHPPLPINGQAEALRALIDHEVCAIAEITADAAGVPWDSEATRRSRLGARVQAGAQLIDFRLLYLLGVDELIYEARSTGLDAADGHDPDTLLWLGARAYVTRTGLEAVLVLLDLRRRVETFVGRTPADRLPVPCPSCNLQSLRREHPLGQHLGVGARPGQPSKVICRVCWRTMTDGDYEQLSDITSELFGVRL